MKPFEHIDAETVDEAVRLLAKSKGKARLIAGGTDLLGVLKDRIDPVYPEMLINVKSISGLNGIKGDAKGLTIGALTRLADVASNPIVQKEYAVLAEAALSVASPQIRNMGTLGGNLAQGVRCWYYRYPHDTGSAITCRLKDGKACAAATGDNRYHALFGGKGCFAVCPSDTAVALAALDATIKIIGPNGERTVPVTEFYHPIANDLNKDEMITEIYIPTPPPGTRQTFIKFRPREAIDFAVVSVASVLVRTGETCTGARVVLGAVAAGPVRAMETEGIIIGARIDQDVADVAAEAALKKATPLSMNGYKLQIVRTLIRRVLLA